LIENGFQTFEAVGALVVVLDADERIIYWNQSCSDLTGYALEEVRGRRFWDFLLIPKEVEPVRLAVRELRVTERAKPLANYWLTKTGERRWIAWSNTLIKGTDGNFRYFVKTGVDQTESKQAEDKLNRITKDLREANEQLVCATIRAQELTDDTEAARSRIEESEHELREVGEFRELFMGIVSHDLRNPLASIRMATNLLLQRGMLDPHTEKQIGLIVRSSQRMSRMISQLLDLTRARLGGGFPLQPKPTDLGEVCRTVVEEFAAAIHLEVEGDLTGTWDPDRLAEALSNIAGNAVEHATPGTVVVVKARAEAADVVVEIINQGEPIPGNVLPFIFEPFRRAKQQTVSATGNLGLGLYIAKQIVNAGGGTLVAYSDGGATTFSMRLPRQRCAAPLGQDDAASVPPLPET